MEAVEADRRGPPMISDREVVLGKGSAMANDERENYTITLAQQIFGEAAAIAGRKPPESKTMPEIKVTSIVVRVPPTTENSPPAGVHLEPIEVEAQKVTDTSEINVTSIVIRHSPTTESSLPAAAANLEPIKVEGKQKQLKTATELAEMIEFDLARHPDCPKAGFRVTVYGWPNWRAMLTIAPAAGGVRNPQEWRDLTNKLSERLRERYALAWE